MTLMMGMRMLVRAPVMLITALVMALTISLQLSQVFLVVLPLLLILVAIVIRYVGPFFTALQKSTDDLNLVVQEDLNAIRVVKSFVREDREQEKFAQRSDTLRNTAERAYSFVVLFVPLVTLIMGGTIMAIMWLGGHYVVGGSMLSGDLIAFFTYASEILMSLMMVAMVMMVLTRSIACGKRIVEVLEEQPEITDSAAAPALTVENGDVDFDHVYFKYHKDSDAWNLEDVCLHIDSGMTVGILGGTGSAKSTLVSLIPRLYEATEGVVSVGGHDVREYTMEALRQGCAMVLQKNTLFSGTIRENLRWGREDATDAEMEEACRMACADEFISRMPDGYDTHIEQGGANVSGGQKQRLCIARAILRRPRVLILDDSTSAVDTATDARIRAALRQALPGSTKLIIAQRISSVMDADLIVVLDNGKISGAGTHDRLMATNRIYQEVYNLSRKERPSMADSKKQVRPGGPHGRGHGYQRPQDLRGTVGKLLGYIGRYKGALIVVAVCLILSSVGSVAGSYFLKPALNHIVAGDFKGLFWMLVAMGGVFLASAGCSYAYSRLMVRISQRTVATLRQDLFNRLQTLPLRYFDTHQSGDLMSRFTNDMDTVSDMIGNSFASVVSNLITFVCTVFMLIYLNWALTLITFAFLGLMLLVVKSVGGRSRVSFQQQQAALGSLNGYIEEMIEGQKVIKVFHHEQKTMDEFAARNSAYRDAAAMAQTYAGSMMPAMGNLSRINYAVTCCVGGLLSISGVFDIGSLGAYLLYVKQVSQPVGQISQQVNTLLAAVAGAERILP